MAIKQAISWGPIISFLWKKIRISYPKWLHFSREREQLEYFFPKLKFGIISLAVKLCFWIVTAIMSKKHLSDLLECWHESKRISATILFFHRGILIYGRFFCPVFFPLIISAVKLYKIDQVVISSCWSSVRKLSPTMDFVFEGVSSQKRDSCEFGNIFQKSFYLFYLFFLFIYYLFHIDHCYFTIT